MRIAVIDMGTNTFNLVVAEIHQNTFQILYSTKEPVKLGQKLKDQHVLSHHQIEKILEVLQKYLSIAQKFSVDKILALATSSIRTAQNKEEIKKNVREKLNLDIQIIDGEREAELIYLANHFAVQSCINSVNDRNFLIMDIGGGSTEFILSDKNRSLWKQSFLLGMARLIDELKPQDPIHPTDILTLKNYLEKHLHPLNAALKQYPTKTLVGSSGVFDSIVEMIEANIHPLPKNDQCCVISKNDFYTIFQKILPLPYSERLKFPGLIEMRADMVTMSLLLIDFVFTNFNLENFIVSFYSLKEGVLIEEMKKVSSIH
ncbi:MAG: hypothetical protein KatS3mg027_2229 [Bacteroidia bacterium]|nr:MAG: hypothetical protein KatS3mg027_2229 [Bacteroidia bacterium]